MSNQTTKRICVTSGSMIINMPQKMMDNAGTTGTKGHLKARSLSGAFFRKTMTAADTMMNAQSVPIFVNSATTPMGRKPATIPQTTQINRELLVGVLYTEWMWPKNFGSKPSRDMTNRIRLWPKIMTSRTEVKPQIAPTETAAAPQ